LCEWTDDTFLRNVGSHNIYMAPHPRRQHSSDSGVFHKILFQHITILGENQTKIIETLHEAKGACSSIVG
jgi:hypothetical protein